MSSAKDDDEQQQSESQTPRRRHVRYTERSRRIAALFPEDPCLQKAIRENPTSLPRGWFDKAWENKTYWPGCSNTVVQRRLL